MPDAIIQGFSHTHLSGTGAADLGDVLIQPTVGDAKAQLVPRSEDEYVGMARELAGDLGKLAEVRKRLRGQMAGSVLMDAPRFAKNMVAAYRQAWKAWCAKG